MPPTDPSAVPIETLVHHAEAIRRLFESALDPALGGDDVAQESFLKAWSGSGEPRQAHLSWWRVLARNFARDARRSHERRVLREQRVARAEAQPSSADIVARADAHRRLVERVLALDEPYRRVVLLRFFDDLDVPAISRATAQSEGTVRTQLHRALKRLRERIEREPEFRSDAALLLGLPLTNGLLLSSAAPISAGSAAMSLGSKCAVLVALAAIATWVAWPRGNESEPSIAALTTEAGSAALPRTDSVESNTRRIATEERGARAAPTVDPDADLGLLLRGRLMSRRGAAIWKEIQGHVTFEDTSGTRTHHKVDDRGTFALFDLEPGTYDVEVVAWRHRPLQMRFELAAAPAVQDLSIALERAPSIPVHFETVSGDPLPIHRIPTLGRSRSIELGVAVSTGAFPAALDPSPFASTVDSNGSIFRRDWTSEECLGRLDILAPFPVHVALLLRNAVVSQQRLDVAPERLVFRIDAVAIAALQSSLRARFVDRASGAPLAAARWELGHRQGSGRPARPVPLADGVLTLTDWSPGRYAFEVDVEGYELWRRGIDLEFGRELDLGTIPLGRAQRVTGRVLDEEGTPRAATLRVTCLDDDVALALDSGTSQPIRGNANGFALERLGARRYAVEVAIARYGSHAFELDLRHGALEDVQWTVPRGRSLRVRVAEPSWSRWMVLVLDAARLPVASWDGTGTDFQRVLVPPGGYRVVLHSSRSGTQTCDVSVLDDENPLVRFR